MQIDYTAFVQIALFVVFWLLLKRLWIDPALKIAHERASRSEGAVNEARAIQAEAAQLRAQHAASLDEVRTETQREMQDILRAAEQEQKRLIAAAREEAQQTLAAVQAKIGEEVATARQELREQARDIAQEVVRKVLGARGMSEHGAEHSPLLPLLLGVANFAIFVGLLVYALRGPIREYFRERTDRLRKALDAGARARHEAEELRAQLAKDVAALPALRERLRGDALATAERERANMIAAGVNAAERIRSDARLLADHEVAAARHALRREIVDEAVREAVEIVRSAIKSDDQARLVREFVSAAGAAPGAAQ